MKKSKLLFPLLTLTGVATIAPIITMTSCSKAEVEEEHFTLKSGAKDQESSYVAGQVEYIFECKDEKFTEEQAKLIEVYAKITKANSYITLQTCSKSYDVASKTVTVLIAYTIDSAAFEYKEEDPEKLEYNIVIHNGTWTQTFDKFTISATRLPKP